MIYGHINSGGTIDTSYAFSNNFTVSMQGSGSTPTYQIVPQFYMYYYPVTTLTTSSSSSGLTINGHWTVDTTTNVRTCTVYVRNAGVLSAQAFWFRMDPGNTLTFDARQNTTLRLYPSIVSFQGQNVLQIHANVNGLSSTAQPTSNSSHRIYLDASTLLTGVMRGGGTLKLQLDGNTYTYPSGGTTYTLTGYTYDTNISGHQWTPDSSGQYYNLSVGASTLISPESFRIVATSGSTTLVGDPVIRLSSVPPPGQVITAGTISNYSNNPSWSSTTSKTTLTYTDNSPATVNNAYGATMYYWTGSTTAPATGVSTLANASSARFSEPTSSGSTKYYFATSGAAGTTYQLELTMTNS